MSRRIMEVRRRPFGVVAPPSTRDPLLHPFASDSPWNTSLGSGAILLSAGLGLHPSTDTKLKTDNIYLGLNPADKLMTLDQTNQANGSTIGGTPYNIPDGTLVHVPDLMSHGGQWNGIAALLDQDRRHVWHGQPIYLRDGTVSSLTDTGPTAGPRWAFTFPQPPNLCDLYGDGLAGSHGGSHLGGLGGCLRAWEWNGTGNIQHVLALNVTSWLYLSQGGTPAGYRWPATKHDSGFTTKGDGKGGGGGNNYYGGSIPDMRMGSLLCLPPTFDLTTITDPQAARLAWTLQHYGCYVVDATGVHDFYALSAEYSVATAISNAGAPFHDQMLGLMQHMMVVTNNSSTNVGGGGSPMAPTAFQIAA